MKIILVNGLPRAGKDTVSDMIVNYTQNRTTNTIQKMSFAEPLKQVIAGTFGISLEDLDFYKNNPEEFILELQNNRSEKIMSTNFRTILQLFGTEGIKPVFGDTVWADLLYSNAIKSNKDIIVVPDFRFMCEFQPNKDVEIISVLVKDKRELPKIGHASDVELYNCNFEFDYTIENVGTLKELNDAVDVLVTKIL